MKQLVSVTDYLELMVTKAQLLTTEEAALLSMLLKDEQSMNPKSYVDIHKKRVIDLYVDNLIMQVNKKHHLHDTAEIMEPICEDIQFYDATMFAGYMGYGGWFDYWDEDFESPQYLTKDPVQTERADI